MRLVAARALERLDDELPLNLLQYDAVRRQAELQAGHTAQDQRRKVFRFEPLAVSIQFGTRTCTG